VLKKYRKYLAATALFLILIVVFPVLLSTLFNKTTVNGGKIVINKQINAPFLDGIKKDNIVLFFGYVGCTKVCTPILLQLASIYESKSIKELHKSTAFVFVNLTPQIPADQPQIFAGGFNKDFVGIHLSQHELLSIEREFALFYSAGIADKSEMTHSDSVYLIKRENGKLTLKNIYMTHPLNSDALTNDLKSIQ
jgi:protein SCO1/2